MALHVAAKAPSQGPKASPVHEIGTQGLISLRASTGLSPPPKMRGGENALLGSSASEGDQSAAYDKEPIRVTSKGMGSQLDSLYGRRRADFP